MKQVRTLSDLALVIEHKLDCYDFQGHRISFIFLAQSRLIDIMQMMESGNLYYNPDDLMR